jgi:sucrose phosphorylase
MENKVQLITYIDRIGCASIQEFIQMIQTEFKDLFGGIHLLPFYHPIDGQDAGFDPINHLEIDSRLGNWNNLKTLGNEVGIMADLIVNHISGSSPQFLDFIEKGTQSEFADLFLTYNKVFPDGATEEELLKIYRPRPGLPFTHFKLNDGTTRLMWTTFTANQIDIDVNSKAGEVYLESILDIFEQSGIKMIRLDAAGYAIKKKGSSSFMIPETFDFIQKLTKKAQKRNIEVLVEIHSYYKTQMEIARKVDYVYDFALPVLVLDTLFYKDATNLKNWLEISPRNALTVLDTHDGIGVVDVGSEDGKPGLIDNNRLDKIVDKIHENTGGESQKATGVAASNLDLYQVNSTYYSALGKNDWDYLAARAIQFCVPGIPQIYYVGLFAGENDMNLLSETNVGRDINRHYYNMDEIKSKIKEPLIQKLFKLIHLRNSHPAFKGTFKLLNLPKHQLGLNWNNDKHNLLLSIDLEKRRMKIIFTNESNLIETLEY